MMKKTIFSLAILALSLTWGSAQKYGHLNLGNLISAMPATDEADKQLAAFQEGLVAAGEELAGKFQQEYSTFVTDVQGGNLTPKAQQERQTALQKQQQDIVAYERQIQQKVQQKREQLLGPIFDRAEEAIQEVAKENGYVMIFDTSVFNAVLFTRESDDVMGMVKAKLGVE